MLWASKLPRDTAIPPVKSILNYVAESQQYTSAPLLYSLIKYSLSCGYLVTPHFWPGI